MRFLTFLLSAFLLTCFLSWGATEMQPNLPVPGEKPNPDATPSPAHHNSAANAEPAPEGSAAEKSVVQIINGFQIPSWSQPWQFGQPQFDSGTGFLIEGNRIMTNAHVVSWTKQLQVRRYHDPNKYYAKVEFIGHDVDLAVLKVDDPHFYDGMQPLQLGDLPKVRSAVVTYGFPAGGDQISYTRGVVSRIEVESYVHPGNRAYLAVQTDAAINPGNSGGPVIQDDKVVGVAFEGVSGLENTGYFIPTSIVHHFLDDIKDGTYDGVPESGLRLAPLENPAYRRKLKLPDDNNHGVRVDSLLDIPTTKALIQPDDVIMQVGDYPVDKDGTITYQGNTVGVSVAFDQEQNNDTLPLKIWRNGQMVDVSMPVHVYNQDTAEGNQYDTLPRYYIYGGLVFTPISLDYLKTTGANNTESGGRELIYELAYRHDEDPANWRPEPVVLTSILDDPVNANLRTRSQTMVDTINGMRINSLNDVPKAFALSKGPDDVIEFLPDHHFEVLRHDDANKANPNILSTYNIPSDRRL